MKFFIIIVIIVISSINLFGQINQALVKTPFGHNAKDQNDNDQYTIISNTTWTDDEVENNIQNLMYSGGIFLQESSSTYKSKSNFLRNHNIHCMTISGSDIFNGSDKGLLKGSFNSSTNIVSWANATEYNFDWEDINVWEILIESDLWLVCTDKGLYINKKVGSNWILDSAFYDPQYPKAITSVCAVGDDYFIGAKDGIYRSTDDGDTWSLSFSTNPVKKVNTLYFDSDNNKLYAGINVYNQLTEYDPTNQTWSSINLSSFYDVLSIKSNNNDLYLGTKSNGFLLYSNGTITQHNDGLFEVTDAAKPIIYDIEIINDKIYIATGSDGSYSSAAKGLFSADIPLDITDDWVDKTVKTTFSLEEEMNFRQLYLYNAKLWLVSNGGKRYPSAIPLDYLLFYEPTPHYYIASNWPKFNCHLFAWHFVEGGISGSDQGVVVPNEVGYIKEDTQGKYSTQNWDYIIAGKATINSFNELIIVPESYIDSDDLENGNWEKVTMVSRGHSGIKTNLSILYIDPYYPDPFVIDDIRIISKWNNNGPLVEHDLLDNPWGVKEIKFWKSNKTVSGTIDSDQFIGRKLSNVLTVPSTTTKIESGEDVEFYVAPMDSHRIVLRDGFHAESGSNFHAFVKQTASKPWEEYKTVKTGVHDKEIESILNKPEVVDIEIEISPLPTKSNTRIKAKIKDFDSYVPIKVDIYSFSGEIVKSLVIQNGVETNIDFKDLASGSYMLAAESEYSSKNGNLVKTAGSEIIIVQR